MQTEDALPKEPETADVSPDANAVTGPPETPETTEPDETIEPEVSDEDLAAAAELEAAQKVIDKEQARLEREDKGEVWKKSQVVPNRYYQFLDDNHSFTAVVLNTLAKNQLLIQKFRNGREAETVEISWKDYQIREITREQAHEWSVV
jgi:hypothetical protein